MNQIELKNRLDELYEKTCRVDFILDDPIGIPHKFSTKEDIELAGFFAAIFAWGQRKTIINKTNDLLTRMDNAPFDFIKNHTEQDRKVLNGFVHRTFNEDDLFYFVHRLQRFYNEENSLENAFAKHLSKNDETIEPALIGFYHDFFDDELSLKRTQKHIASPAKKSTCKRLCMYHRWMVRQDTVDFGIWKSISPSQLLMPFDVHVERTARQFNLIARKQKDWKTVVELTNNLRSLNPTDPVKYDFALFGGSVMGMTNE